MSQVWHNSASIWRQAVGGTLRPSVATAVEIRVHWTDLNGWVLDVKRNGTVLILELALPGWAPSPSWEFGLVALIAVGSDPAPCTATSCLLHLIDSLEVVDESASGQVRTSLVEFAVTVNAQQYSRDYAPFGFFAPLEVGSASPPSGSRRGGTLVRVHGANFFLSGTHFLCSFGVGARVAGRSAAQWDSFPGGQNTACSGVACSIGVDLCDLCGDICMQYGCSLQSVCWDAFM